MNANQQGQPKPPGQGTSRSARRRRNRRRNQGNQSNQQRATQNQPGRRNRNPNTGYTRGQPRSSQPGTGVFLNSETGSGIGTAVRTSNILRPTVTESESSETVAAYVAAVMDPTLAKPTRCPTMFPFPSACTKLTWEGTFKANSSGNFQLICQPQGGIADGGWNAFVQILNHDSFTEANNWEQTGNNSATEVGVRSERITNTTYTRWRVVGASLKATYVGSTLDEAGYMISAFMTRNAMKGTQNAVAANTNALAIYAGWSESILKEAYYNTTIFDLSKTAECLYVPRDDVDMVYIDQANGRSTSCCVIAGYGLKAASNIRWQFDLIMEYLPSQTNYVADVGTVKPGLDGTYVIQSLASQVPSYITSPASDYSVFEDVKSKAFLYAQKGAAILADSVMKTAKDYVGGMSGKKAGSATRDLLSMIVSRG